MKNSIQRRILDLQNGILYIMSFCFLVLVFFIVVLFQNKNADNFNIVIAISGGTIAFFLIYALLHKLNKNIKSAEIAKNKLAANELKYRNLIENAGITMYTTTFNGLVTFASSKASDLTGYNIDEIIGMHFTQFITEEWVDIVKAKYKNQVKNDISETVFEFCIRTKQGDLKWVEQSAVLLKENNVQSGFQCITKDISERKKMEEVVRKYEEELVYNQELLQSVLDNATSLIYIKNLEGKYLLVNKQFKESLNVSDETVLGKTDFDFADPVKAQSFKETDEQVIKTCKPVQVEDIIELPGGKRHILVTKFPLINTQNEIYGISGIATDISERVIYQQELIKARRIAEDAKRLQEQFLANMSHEIRTPMNGIQGMTDLLLETKLNDEQKDFAKTIKRSSDNLLVIINDILDFSKIKAGKLTIEKIDFELNEVLENVKAIFRHRVKEKGLTFTINPDTAIPARLNGDPYRLNQILVNLIGNAIKFTHTGGVGVTVIAKAKNPAAVVLEFAITDTGIGIETNKINDVFESFTQASVETARKYGGSGLGLAITKQLLEMQNGHISVESTIDSGTTFRFSIPYGYSQTSAPSFFRGEDSENFSSILKGKKFLVAEDNEVNQKVIKHVLHKAGAVVDVANNGLEAIAFLNKSNNYNLIIMDLQMPEMDGYAATKYIRNVMNLTTPIIAMTASALKGEKSKCIEIGMNDYLSKPFDFHFLYKRILILLDNQIAGFTSKVVEEPLSNELFDLSIIEEMDDDEYLTEILSLFLDNTPQELNELQTACSSGDFQNAYKIAHKLKSSTGLFKANDLLQVLIEIEKNAKDEQTGLLEKLADKATAEFKKIETPLKKYLANIKVKPGVR